MKSDAMNRAGQRDVMAKTVAERTRIDAFNAWSVARKRSLTNNR